MDIRNGRFALNMRFFANQLFRVLADGCNFCCHIQQLLAYKNQHGFAGRRNFRDAMVDVFGAEGFELKGEVAIPKDPQVMANKLNLHSLQFKTGHSRTATDWAMAPNDYVMVFQKPGEVKVPVRPLIYREGRKPIPRWMFDASRVPPATTFAGPTDLQDEFWHPWRHRGDNTSTFSDAAYVAYLREWGAANKAKNAETGWLGADDWIKLANGVWPDINEIDVLRPIKEHDHERHVCPLQLSVIQRCVELYSNPIAIQPDVTVLDPFMGIGSSAFVCVGGRSPLNGFAVHAPRNVIGFELKDAYHAASLDYLAQALAKAEKKDPEQRTFYDMITQTA